MVEMGPTDTGGQLTEMEQVEEEPRIEMASRRARVTPRIQSVPSVIACSC